MFDIHQTAGSINPLFQHLDELQTKNRNKHKNVSAISIIANQKLANCRHFHAYTIVMAH